MNAVDLTVGVTGTYTPQRVLAKYVFEFSVTPHSPHFLDPEVEERVREFDGDTLLIIPLRHTDRYGRPVGAVTVE